MIDAHHHLWRLGANGCSWPTADLHPIYRDIELAEYEAIARATGVTGSVLVQSQACDADTEYLLQVAAGSGFIKAVVGWVDLASPAAVARISQLVEQSPDGQKSKLRGLRPMLQSLTEDDWLLRPELEPAVQAMQLQGLVLDALIYPRHLPYLYEFARRHPGLPIVINHGAKPPIATGNQLALDWCRAMAAIAELPNVFCKISGLPTEAGSGQSAMLLSAYIGHLYEVFGAARLMWGSDWPVLELAADAPWGTYQGWLSLVQSALGRVETRCLDEACAQIFEGTSLGFYRIVQSGAQ